MPEEFKVPDKGVVPYTYFVTPTHFKQDVWVQAAEANGATYTDTDGTQKDILQLLKESLSGESTATPRWMSRMMKSVHRPE